MSKPPKMTMPTDLAIDIFAEHHHFMVEFDDQEKWDNFDQQYKITSIKLLTKIAIELEKLNSNQKATSTE